MNLRLLFAGLLAGALFASLTPALQDQDPEAGPTEVRIGGLDGGWRTTPLGPLRLTALDAGTARLRFPGNAAVLPDAGFRVRLLSGDTVHGTVADGDEAVLGLRVRGGAEVALPIEAVRELRAVDLRDQVGLDAPEAGDRLWRRVGEAFDRVDGLLVAFGPAGVTFEGQLGEREYPWSEVGALWVEPLGGAPTFDAGARAVAVDLVDGSRLRGGFERLENGKLFLDVGEEDALVFDTAGLLEVNLDDARLTFVSELEFERVGPPGLFGDDLGLQVPPVRDRAVVGTPLMARGTAFARGVGVHAPSRLRLDWTQGGTLRGAVAIDDSVQRLAVDGAVVFRIHLDGELAFESKELTVNSPLVPLPTLDLTGKRTLELEVDAASGSVMGDRANWLDLCITREG